MSTSILKDILAALSDEQAREGNLTNTSSHLKTNVTGLRTPVIKPFNELIQPEPEAQQHNIPDTPESLLNPRHTRIYLSNMDTTQPAYLQNIIDRLDSVFTAAYEMAPDNKEKKEQLTQLRTQILTSITQEKNEAKFLNAKIIKVFQNQWMPQIISIIAKPNKNYKALIAALREKEIMLLSQKKRPHLYTEFMVPGIDAVEKPAKRFSFQTPISRLTKEQAIAKYGVTANSAHYCHTCYQRDTEGRANFTKQIIGRIETKANENNKANIHMSFYRGASLPPIGLKNSVERFAITQRNVKQTADNIARDLIQERLAAGGLTADHVKSFTSKSPLTLPISEIRLLSVLKRSLSGFDLEQMQFQQTLETLLAYQSLNGKTIEVEINLPNEAQPHKVPVKIDASMVSFGVNFGRRKLLRDPLHDWMNVAGLNKTYAHAFAFLNRNHPTLLNGFSFNMSKELTPLYQELQTIYADFNNFIVKSNAVGYDETAQKSYQKYLQQIQDKLKEIHPLELKRLKDFHQFLKKHHKELNDVLIHFENKSAENKEVVGNGENLSKETYAVLHSLMQVDNLFFKQDYFAAENNYWIQSNLARLNHYMGRHIVTGCNDDKDRGGRLANTIEAEDEFFERYHHFPRYENKDDRKKLYHIQAYVHDFSSNRYRGDLAAAPGAVDFQIYAADGNKHLSLKNSFLAKLGKEIYHVSKFKNFIMTLKLKIKALFGSPNVEPKLVVNKHGESMLGIEHSLHQDPKVTLENIKEQNLQMAAEEKKGFNQTTKNDELKSSKKAVDLAVQKKTKEHSKLAKRGSTSSYLPGKKGPDSANEEDSDAEGEGPNPP